MWCVCGISVWCVVYMACGVFLVCIRCVHALCVCLCVYVVYVWLIAGLCFVFGIHIGTAGMCDIFCFFYVLSICEYGVYGECEVDPYFVCCVLYMWVTYA